MLSEEQAYSVFQQHVDRLCFLIVASSCSDREIDIERVHLRTQAMKLFPDKMQLYELIYESRFLRLRRRTGSGLDSDALRARLDKLKELRILPEDRAHSSLE